MSAGSSATASAGSALASIERTRPCGTGERTKAACHMPSMAASWA